ncbi:MAG TPA: sulfotransferase [Leptolyngbyaceae cyanobacterium]
MPNFLIIGAPKAGTTALYQYLKQHPQIYMSPVKEPGFFAFEGMKLDSGMPFDRSLKERPTDSIERYQYLISNAITDLETYQDLFASVSNQIAIGEASPGYLYHPKACERIHHYIPDAKLIAILRHPVDRAYSSFVHRVQQNLEPITDFNQVIQKEDFRVKDVWWGTRHYVRVGFYCAQIKRYLDTFDKQQLKVYLYEDLASNPVKLIQDIFQFIGVDETVVPDVSTKHLVSGIPKSKFWHNFLNRKSPIKDILKQLIPAKIGKQITSDLRKRNLTKPPLSPDIRRQLIEVYKEDILNLQDLIDRDLSIWLK